MQNRVDNKSPNTNSDISNRNRDGFNRPKGNAKEANEFGTNTEKNKSKNHTGRPSGNKNTQKLQQNADDLENHSLDIKPESDYQSGAQDEIGNDARRSRQKAKDFQNNRF